MNKYIRWLIPIICLMIIWFSIWYLLYLKADEITKDPCSICAKRMGKDVLCTQLTKGNLIPAQRYYFTNGSIYEPGVSYKDVEEKFEFNLTLIGG